MRLNLHSIQSADYARNIRRGQSSAHGACRVCGRAINPKRAVPVHEVDGGGMIATPDEPWGGDDDLYTQYIGADCFRKHRETLAPYDLRTS